MVEAKAPLAAAEKQFLEEVHAQKARALDRLVEKRLLEARAKKEGITVEALLDREVGRKVPEPAEAILQAVYDQTKATGRALPPFSEVKAEIAAFVKGQSAQELRQQFVARLRAEVEGREPPAAPPPRRRSPSRRTARPAATPGPRSRSSSSRTTSASFCARRRRWFAGCSPSTGERSASSTRRSPSRATLAPPRRPRRRSARGSRGGTGRCTTRLFAGQGALGIDDLKGRARALQLDAPRFDACLDSGRMAPVVEASRKLGDGIGVNATPAFFVNGRPLSGLQPFERFKELVDHELASASR